MPSSFLTLIPIVFFIDLIVIAIGFAYSARKAGKSVFELYDPRPAVSILAAYVAGVVVVSFLIFLDQTAAWLPAVFYTFLFNTINLIGTLALFVFIGRALLGRAARREAMDSAENPEGDA